MDWTDLEICAFHLPNLARLKPVVWCRVRVKAVVGLGLLNQLVLKEGGVLGQVLIREPCPDLANALVLLVLGLITSKKEASIFASALALAQVASQDDEVKGVSNPLQVVLLQLQPIMRSAGDLIGCVYVQCLHHQTLAVIFDGLFQSLLNLLSCVAIHTLGKLELALHCFEVISQHLPALFKRLCDQTLPVEKEKVKGKDANLDLDLLLHVILPLPGGEHLERLDALLLPIPGHSLTIQHRRLEALSQAGLEASNDVGELGSVVLLVAAEDVHLPILVQVDLGSLPIVLPLTGEPAVLKPGEHLLDSLGGMCQHRFQWDPRSESTTRSQTIDACLEKGRQENVVAGTLTVGGLQLQTLLGKLLFELLSLSVLVHRGLGGRVLLARGGSEHKPGPAPEAPIALPNQSSACQQACGSNTWPHYPCKPPTTPGSSPPSWCRSCARSRRQCPSTSQRPPELSTAWAETWCADLLGFALPQAQDHQAFPCRP